METHSSNDEHTNHEVHEVPRPNEPYVEHSVHEVPRHDEPHTEHSVHEVGHTHESHGDPHGFVGGHDEGHDLNSHSHEEAPTHWRNKSKSHTALYALIVALIILGFGGFVLYRGANFFKTPVHSVGAVVNVDKPNRLFIPVINVDANIQSVGLTASGRVGIPNNFTDVAWFNQGPKPGDAGSAVINGHLDTAKDVNAVFINLDQLRQGDLVYVTDAKGVKMTFRVVKTAIYDDSNAPLAEIFDTTGSIAKLNLITCDGVWIQKVHSYTQRLVVFTERVID